MYQAWRNPRAKVGGDLYDIKNRIRAIEVRRALQVCVALGDAEVVTLDIGR